jgi:hypothetical protein
MKRHLTISASLFLATSLVLVSVAPASFASTVKPKALTKATIKPKVAAKATVKPKAKAKAKIAAPKPITKPTARAEETGINRFASLTTAQRGCLVKHGITIPAPRSSTAARPTPNPTRSPGSFAGRGNFDPTKMTAAYKACGVAIPAGGFARGGFSAFNSAKFKTFQKCMTTAGITTTGGFGRYDESDPSTVAALVKCQKSSGFTLPKFGQPGSGN